MDFICPPIINQSDAPEMLKCRQQMIDIYLLPRRPLMLPLEVGEGCIRKWSFATDCTPFAMVTTPGLVSLSPFKPGPWMKKGKISPADDTVWRLPS